MHIIHTHISNSKTQTNTACIPATIPATINPNTPLPPLTKIFGIAPLVEFDEEEDEESEFELTLAAEEEELE